MATNVSQQRLSSGLATTVASSPQSAVGKRTPVTSKRPPKKFICPICLEKVEDATGKKKGHDSVFCDGACQEWLHRQCAGLSKAAFSLVRSSSESFHCPRCLIARQSAEIASLKDSVKQLSSEISNLKAMVVSLCERDKVPLAESPPTVSPDAVPVSLPRSNESHSTSLQPQSHHGSKSLSSVSDRKFNIVIFGVSELSDCSSRFLRHDHDFQEVSLILSNLELGPNRSSSIRDCHRLGKYVSSSVRPRPLLVQLNC